MGEVALRCAACGAALRIPDHVHSIACQRCGASLAVGREGGGVYTAVDRELGGPGATPRADQPPAFQRPGRTASAAGGLAAAAAGGGWAALGFGSGSWTWAAAGALVAAVGLAAALRGLARRQSD